MNPRSQILLSDGLDRSALTAAGQQARSRQKHGRPSREGAAALGVSGASDVLGARAFRPLTRVERERLALTELVETPVDDGGLVEEVLVSVRRLDEPETLVANQALDDALHAGHVNISRRRRRRTTIDR
jgi:hypothetical protein